jgi:hypothetical protein
MGDKKKHHFVSQFILNNFANDRGQLSVSRMDGTPEYIAKVSDIGHRNNGFRVEELHEDHTYFEDLHSVLESSVAEIFHGWQHSEARPVTEAERDLVERFIVLHMMRWPVLSDSLLGTLDESLAGLGQVAHLPEVQILKRDLLVEAVSYAAGSGRAEQWDMPVGGDRWQTYKDELANFRWVLIRFQDPMLLIGDRLVNGFGRVGETPRSPRWKGSTFGDGGLSTWTRITIPFSPFAGLLLTRNPELMSLRPERFNQSTICNSREFVAYSPRWPQTSPDMFESARALIREQIQYLSEGN